MVVQNIYLEDWDWHVTVYYAVDTYYTDEILEELELIGFSWSELVKAENLLRSNQYNIGTVSYTHLAIECKQPATVTIPYIPAMGNLVPVSYSQPVNFSVNPYTTSCGC